MSGEIVNLRRLRKTKQRAAEADTAAQNRLRFGRSKAQRAFETKIETLEQRQFEAHRRTVGGNQNSAAENIPADNNSVEDAPDGG
ncbi:MAG: DUF4169 family protein [Methylovirgula sp.]